MDALSTEIVTAVFDHFEDRKLVALFKVSKRCYAIARRLLIRRVTRPAQDHPWLVGYVERISLDEHLDSWGDRIRRNYVNAEIQSRASAGWVRELGASGRHGDYDVIPRLECDPVHTNEAPYARSKVRS